MNKLDSHLDWITHVKDNREKYYSQEEKEIKFSLSEINNIAAWMDWTGSFINGDSSTVTPTKLREVYSYCIKMFCSGNIPLRKVIENHFNGNTTPLSESFFDECGMVNIKDTPGSWRRRLERLENCKKYNAEELIKAMPDALVYKALFGCGIFYNLSKAKILPLSNFTDPYRYYTGTCSNCSAHSNWGHFDSVQDPGPGGNALETTYEKVKKIVTKWIDN